MERDQFRGHLGSISTSSGGWRVGRREEQKRCPGGRHAEVAATMGPETRNAGRPAGCSHAFGAKEKNTG